MTILAGDTVEIRVPVTLDIKAETQSGVLSVKGPLGNVRGMLFSALAALTEAETRELASRSQ